MAGKTKTTDSSVNPREIDFVSRFNLAWESLLDIMGISRPIKKEMGAVLRQKKATIVLENGAVEEGATIPFSKATITETPIAEMGLEKYAKSITAELIKKDGYEVAVEKTDNAFLNELQNKVTNQFYTFLNTGSLTHIEDDFQSALAMAKGLVLNKFKSMNLDGSEVVGFANILDFYKYLGSANITVQTEFGMNYIQGFMGYRVIFLLSENEIQRGRVIACPVENINFYYVDPSDSAFANAGLEYTTEGVTPLLGFHTEGDYRTASSDAFAIMGLALFAEYLDAIAVVDIEASGSLGSITVASIAGDETGDSKITVTYTKGAGETLWCKEDSAAISVSYLDEVDLSSWDAISTGDHQISDLTEDNYLTVIAVNGSGQAVASGNAQIVVKAESVG